MLPEPQPDYYGSRISLADQGNLGIASESGGSVKSTV